MKPQLVIQDFGGQHNADLDGTSAIKKRYDPIKYKIWYDKNSEKKRSYARDYYSKNTEQCIAASKKRRVDNPGCWIESHRKRLYGIDNSEFDRLLSQQINKCAICGVVFDRRKKKTKPHIDHDHKTGKVRGLLCSGCNISLGHLEKDMFLEKALKYLEDK